MTNSQLVHCTGEVFILAALGFIDSPGGAEWKRLRSEGSITPEKIESAIQQAQDKVRTMSEEDITKFWK